MFELAAIPIGTEISPFVFPAKYSSQAWNGYALNKSGFFTEAVQKSHDRKWLQTPVADIIYCREW